MVPKLHAKGSSFRGLASYVLHDKGWAETAERVAWTATRNLAVENPEVAWKLMAATAMDADRLKARAGVKNTGRKSKDAVLHLTLSWHPNEAGDLDRDEMLRAADGALRALGAEGRQVLVVAHSDEKQPHLHVVINRVSPEDGRMLPSSNEKLALSRWAQAYERERGDLLCEQRAINNAARDRGEYVRGEKDVPRHLYELHAANHNRSDRAEHHRRQREQDREVGRRQRAAREQQAAAWAALIEGHRRKRAEILAQRKADTRRAVEEIRASYRRNQWTRLHREQAAEMKAFERDEASFLGRMKNRARAIDLKALLWSDRGEGRRSAIGDAFNALSSSGVRRELLRRAQAKQEAVLATKQRAEERRVARDIGAATRTRLAEARQVFQADRAALVMKIAVEAAAMRAAWEDRAERRREAAERYLDIDLSGEQPAPGNDLAELFRKMRASRQDPDRGDGHER
jgi:hypothetical protein